MTFDHFQTHHIDVLKQQLDHLSATKGKEYAHDADRFANFKRLADQIDLPADKILWVYFTKHLDSITHYLKLSPEERASAQLSEPIQGRIHDAIMYLCLLDGLWEDLKMYQAVGNNYPVPQATKNILGLEPGARWRHNRSKIEKVVRNYNQKTDEIEYLVLLDGSIERMDRNNFTATHAFMQIDPPGMLYSANTPTPFSLNLRPME